MAFNKRTWKGRQGTGLNKFSIDGATPVTVVNQPDSITEQGDALSAGNLNNLENRIAEAFDETASVSDVESLQQETTALQQKTNALQKQIDNITEAEDLIETVDYANGENAVPPNKAKYAEVSVLKGVSRVENQMIRNGNFAGYTNWSRADAEKITFTVADNVATVTMKADVSTTAKYTYGIFQVIGKTIAGHRYLIRSKVKSEGTSMLYDFDNYSTGRSITLTPNVWTDFIVLTDSVEGNHEYFYIFPDTGLLTGQSFQVTGVAITDLTQYFNGNIPSNAQTIADIQQNYPELLVPSAYNAGSLVDTTYSAVKAVGVNLWDEVWELGDLNSNNGADYPDNNRIRSKNKNPIVGGIAHYLKCSVNAFFCYYDENENYIRGAIVATNSSFTPPANAWYFRFSLVASYGTTYNNDIQICLKSYADKTTYHPYMTDTLSLPSPVTLRSAGNVADTDELNVEVDGVERRRQTRRVGQVDGGTLDWQSGSTNTSGKYRFTASLPIAISQNTTIVANILCSRYIAASPLQTYRCVTGVSNNNNNSQIIVYDESYAEKSASEFKEHVTGVIFNYELADPVVTLLDPVTDPFIQVEGGGTIKPVQTNEPEIDSAMTVTYVNKVTA